jgi:hypothetical protein
MKQKGSLKQKIERGEQMNNKALVSFYQASERLGVSYWALWRGAEAGFFKTVYLGARRMIPQSEIAHIEEYGFGKSKRRRVKGESANAAR